MAKHMKGKLKEVVECCNAINLLSKEDGSQVAQVMDEEGDDLTDTQKANAKELVCRWNAFEEDGFVSDLLAACEEVLVHIPEASVSFECKHYKKGQGLLTIAFRVIEVAIDKAKKGFEDGKSTKDDS